MKNKIEFDPSLKTLKKPNDRFYVVLVKESKTYYVRDRTGLVSDLINSTKLDVVLTASRVLNIVHSANIIVQREPFNLEDLQ